MSKMTDNDYELLEMAMETTYASSIRSYIKEADTEECRKRLRRMLAPIESMLQNKNRSGLKPLFYGAQNKAYMSRSVENMVSGLCFNELGSDA